MLIDIIFGNHSMKENKTVQIKSIIIIIFKNLNMDAYVIQLSEDDIHGSLS